MNQSIITWDKVATEYGAFIHERTILGPALMKIFQQEKLRYKKVADIGCGIGVYARILSDKFKNEVIGFDISSRMIDIARAHDRLKKIDFRIASADKLPLRSNSVDAVLMSTLISNFDNSSLLKKSIREAWRILKHDGIIITATPHPCFEKISYPQKRIRIHEKGYTYFSDGAAYKLMLYREDKQVVEVTNYHWTLETQLDAFIKAGFSIKEIVEPMPTKPLGDESRYPVYLIIIASKI